jgi:Fe-S-cluster containining protein
MECRADCGACCIAISISSPIPGMPDGKPAGVRCIHLLDDYKFALFGDSLRPKVCSDYKAEEEFCGKTREDAMRIIKYLIVDPPNPPKGGLIFCLLEDYDNIHE